MNPELSPLERPAFAAIDVFHYQSVGALLRDYVESRKKAQPSFSFRLLARRLQLKSASQLTMIAREERQPSQSLLFKIACYFNLSTKETHYLSAITRLRRKQPLKEKEHFLAVSEHLKDRDPELVLELAEIQLLGSWHAFAIMAMTDIKGFAGSAEEVVGRLNGRISSDEAEEAIALLLDLGILERAEDGRLRRTNRFIRTARGPRPMAAVQELHRSVCDLAKVAVSEQSVEERFFSNTMLAIPADKVKLAQKLIVEFRESFLAEMASGSGDKVYNLGLQFFRMGK